MQLLTVILLSHTQGLLAYFSETHIASLNTSDLSNLNRQSLLSWTSSHHNIKFTCNFFIMWTQFSNWGRKSRKVNFLITINEKVNFSYWLSFLLLSWDSYMPVSLSSLSFSFLSFSEIFGLSSMFKTRLYHSFFLSTTRTESLCWDHHKESLDCRPVRLFISIHCHQQHYCHQQHHSHQKHWTCCNL